MIQVHARGIATQEARTEGLESGGKCGECKGDIKRRERHVSKNKLGFLSAKAVEGSQAVRPRTRCPPQAKNSQKRLLLYLVALTEAWGAPTPSPAISEAGVATPRFLTSSVPDGTCQSPTGRSLWPHALHRAGAAATRLRRVKIPPTDRIPINPLIEFKGHKRRGLGDQGTATAVMRDAWSQKTQG